MPVESLFIRVRHVFFLYLLITFPNSFRSSNHLWGTNRILFENGNAKYWLKPVSSAYCDSDSSTRLEYIMKAPFEPWFSPIWFEVVAPKNICTLIKMLVRVNIDLYNQLIKHDNKMFISFNKVYSLFPIIRFSNYSEGPVFMLKWKLDGVWWHMHYKCYAQSDPSRTSSFVPFLWKHSNILLAC